MQNAADGPPTTPVERRPPRHYAGVAVLSLLVLGAAVAGVPLGWISPISVVVIGAIALGGVVLNLYLALADPDDATLRRLDPTAEDWRDSRRWQALTLGVGLALAAVGLVDLVLFPTGSGSFVMVALGLVMIVVAGRALRAR